MATSTPTACYRCYYQGYKYAALSVKGVNIVATSSRRYPLQVLLQWLQVRGPVCYRCYYRGYKFVALFVTGVTIVATSSWRCLLQVLLSWLQVRGAVQVTSVHVRQCCPDDGCLCGQPFSGLQPGVCRQPHPELWRKAAPGHLDHWRIRLNRLPILGLGTGWDCLHSCWDLAVE